MFFVPKNDGCAVSGGGAPPPLDPRPGRFAPEPRPSFCWTRQGGDFISPLTLGHGVPPVDPDKGERSCSPRPHDTKGDFALPLDPHRAGPEGVPPSPAPSPLATSVEATVPPVDHGPAFVETHAKAAGLSLEDFLRREILRPLTEEELAGAAPTQN